MLARADQGWLSRLITCRVPLEERPDAPQHRSHDEKVVVDFGA